MQSNNFVHSRIGPFAAVFLGLVTVVVTDRPARSAPVSSTIHATAFDALDVLIANDDLIQGRQTVGFDIYDHPSDSFGNLAIPGWHPANTDPADQHGAFTDGLGILSTGLTGLLNDNFPPEAASGRPVKVVEFPFDSPTDVGRLNIFSGNRNNADGRIFSSVFIEYSTGGLLQPLGYFQSDPSGTVNSETAPVPPLDPAQHSTMLTVFDDSSPALLSGITSLVFNFYSVDNTGGQMRDPFDGPNPFTGTDDLLAAAFVSPLVYEIDVLPPGPLATDFNGDGTVDAADYTFWRDNRGTLFSDDDYEAWKLTFGLTAPVEGTLSAGASVPEPSTCLLGAAMLSFLAAAIRFPLRVC